MRTFRRRQVPIIAGTLAALVGIALPTLADKADKQGWSLSSDPRKRVFLTFVPANNGPRILVLGCLRDVDNFIVLSEQNTGTASAEEISLRLANGSAQYDVQGRIEPNGAGVGHPGFASELDADAKALLGLRARLLPVLEGKGPIVLSLGSISRELPVAGLGKLLNGFKSVCFGRR